MPQEKEKRYRPPSPSQPQNEPEERKRTPTNDELDDLEKEAEEIIRKNKENTRKKQPGRE